MITCVRMINVLLFLSITIQATGIEPDVLKYINPFIGTRNGGNVFPGATRPHSFAKAVADVDSFNNQGSNQAGFTLDGTPIIGFSATHDSGTGSRPSLGNFALFPELCPQDDIDQCKFERSERMINYDPNKVEATPGYFSVDLVNQIQSRMTIGERSAMFEFTFPHASIDDPSPYSNHSRWMPWHTDDPSVAPLILLDLNDLQLSRRSANITIDAETGLMTGNGMFLPSFGGGSYIMHFCANFVSNTSMRDNGIFINHRAASTPKQLSIPRGWQPPAGGWIRFEPDTTAFATVVTVQVGLSYISTERACSNIAVDLEDVFTPTTKSLTEFDALRAQAEDVWRNQLSIITVDTTSAESNPTLFYSALYRTMINPQNYTNENPLWQSDEPYFDSLYCIWDTFRTMSPLYTVLEPVTITAIIRSMVDTQKHTGWLPDCRMSHCKGYTQSGSNADVVLADAYAKNLTAHIDWSAALAAVIQDAEVEPVDWYLNGRGGLHSWHNLGYIPYEDFDYTGFGIEGHSISRTLEYAYNDYCIGTLSKGLESDNYTTYLQRSQNWKNLWKSDQNSTLFGISTNFTGFAQPRNANGSWAFQDPTACAQILNDWCTLGVNVAETYESSIWEYSFFVPHDVQSLIDTMGGVGPFLRRLRFIIDSGLLEITNEPSFLVPFLPHYASRPYESSKNVHNLVEQYFNTSAGGLPGNDDSGTMSAWLVFVMLGIFPNAGQNVYFLTAPFFENWSITNQITGKTANMRVVNGTFGKGLLIDKVWVNGEEWYSNWIGHEFFTEGWTMEMELREQESGWGMGLYDMPPSLSNNGLLGNCSRPECGCPMNEGGRCI